MPKGDLGIFIGYTPELRSYTILDCNNRIIQTKSLKFLDFDPSSSSSNFDEDLIINKSPPLTIQPIAPEEEEVSPDPTIKLEESEDNLSSSEDFDTAELIPDSSRSPSPIPAVAPSRILRERTLNVRPAKYSYFSAPDPKSFNQALKNPDAKLWKSAIDEELNNIESHDVWSECHSTPSKYLHSTWVFRTKPATNSSSEKKKARLCIQGFQQIPGIDFDETFAPTGKFPSLLTLLVLAIDQKLPIKQFYVKSAFLFAPLKEEIYIKTPLGSARSSPFLKLNRSLYGLKQSPMNWYHTLTSWFQEIDFTPSTSDPCLFISKNRSSFVFFHVDDLIVVGDVSSFEKLFLNQFPNSSAHSPDTLLGMTLSIKPNLISLSQTNLIDKVLDLLHLSDCHAVKTPLSPSIQLPSDTDEDHSAFLKLNINYRSYTGILNYLACRTRPDLSPAVSILSRFNHKPGLSHWNQVLHCWKYLKGTRDMALLLQPSSTLNPSRINFYTDATWADDQETRLSQSGTIAFWKSCPISWNSKKQKNITLSSTESEMNALADGEQENQWLSHLIEELWNDKLPPTLFHIDNCGLLEKLKNFGSNSKTKHLDIKIKDLRNKFKTHSIDVQLVSSSKMIADALSKASSFESLKRLQDHCLTVLSSSNKEGC